MDGRDPLFYRCDDLETYTKEIDTNKLSLLLVNKSDLLPDHVRQKWSDYFNKKGIAHMFFSAKIEQETINLEEEEAAKAGEDAEIAEVEGTKKEEVTKKVEFAEAETEEVKMPDIDVD